MYSVRRGMNKVAEVPKLFVQSNGYLFSGNSRKVLNCLLPAELWKCAVAQIHRN
jgi:hypothetical protein